MLNNTFTATTPLVTGSYLASERTNVIETIARQELSTWYWGHSLLDESSQYSIQISRYSIKAALKDYEFETAYEEVDFLRQNYDVFELLPSLGDYFKKCFHPKSKLTLELLDEGPDWKTLFINISTTSNWEKSKEIIDKFLDNIFDLYPRVAEKININVIPDGI